MARVRVIVSVEIDDLPMAGVPVIRSMECTHVRTTNAPKEMDIAGDFPALVIAQDFSVLQGFMLTPDGQMNLRVGGQTDGGILINPGGLLLLIDGAVIPPTGGKVIAANSVQPQTNRLRGFVAGS